MKKNKKKITFEHNFNVGDIVTPVLDYGSSYAKRFQIYGILSVTEESGTRVQYACRTADGKGINFFGHEIQKWEASKPITTEDD